jgi:hypothetical protein
VEQTNGADLSITWARTRPAPTARDEIRFGRADADILKEAARLLRGKEPLRDERILGYVTNLHRTEEQVDGRVTIKAILEGAPRSLVATLPPAQYQIALRAHEIKAPVSLVADIEVAPRTWRVIDPRDIRIMHDEEDETLN